MCFEPFANRMILSSTMWHITTVGLMIAYHLMSNNVLDCHDDCDVVINNRHVGS